MKLYDYYRSSAAYRLRIALNIKGLKPERHPVNLLKGEQQSDSYKAVNPQGLVPTLVDGATTLTQSIAVIEYLNDVYPNPPLLPADPVGRARVRAIALTIACDIHPINNLRVLNYLTDTIGVSKEVKQQWYEHWIQQGFTTVETMLQNSATGTYCHGNQLSLADICLVPQVVNAKRFACNLDPYPAIRRIFQECEDLVPFADAHPENQPEAVTK
jgi:maleylacetoacetate isomerase